MGTVATLALGSRTFVQLLQSSPEGKLDALLFCVFSQPDPKVQAAASGQLSQVTCHPIVTRRGARSMPFGLFVIYSDRQAPRQALVEGIYVG